MAGTFTQLFIHFVIAVKGRQSLIQERFRQELEAYIAGIIHKRDHKLLAIYCMPDHAHILIGKRPTQSESELMRDIKANSSVFIRGQGWLEGEFAWQDGYGAFSHAKSQLDKVIRYILNQPNHHKDKSFKEEYMGILTELGVEHDPRYLFEWIGDVPLLLEDSIGR